jgi:hypothetical protein
VKRVALAVLVLLLVAPVAHAGSSQEPAGPPVSVAGARVVDLRDTSGGLQRYTSIPSTSVFHRHGGSGSSCSFTSPLGGTTSDGQRYSAGQVVRSQRWLFIEGLPESIGEPTPKDPSVVKGPLASAVRYFTVFCDTTNHFVTILTVTARDSMFDPHRRLDQLYHGLQLVRPVVYRNPVVDKWGGLITRYPAWLAVAPAAWRSQRSNVVTWRGWTMYLLAQPVAMDFVVDFRPDRAQPSPAFKGVVGCVARGSTPTSSAVALPAMPTLPAQSAPGVNGSCRWTPPGPGSVVVQARITYRVTFWASGYTETLPDYVWTSVPATFRTGELSAVNTTA